MDIRRVVITGIGTVNPLGNNVHDFFENLNIGKSGACPISRFDTTLFKTRFACEVKNFDPTSYGIDRKEIKKLDRYSQYAMVAADEAIADSGLDIDKVDKSRVGVIIGSGIGGLETLSQEIMGYCDGGKIPRFNPFLIPKLIPDIAAGCVSIKYGFMGPNYATVSACASSSHAIGDSYNAIKYGKAEVIISGGAEACVTIPSVGGFNSAQALSTNNDEYETASRPFDKTRDGFVLGEGSGILVLEEYNHAKERGAHIYAEIIGMGMSADAYHITAPHPEGKGAILAMNEALKDASISPEDVDYINVHGTSTPLGDMQN
jgi:3-oxoacyl-(acyl-carrier-protein) synthase